jgi:integrase/recombinase XerD
MIQNDLAPVPADAWQTTDALSRAIAAYLTRFTGASRDHACSDLRAYLSWCAERHLHPLTARRPHLELYIRWMQEIRRFKPSTVSRRFSVVAGFYRTAVIDGDLDHSPAEHVRRPSVPPESPTLGFTHLQFEATLTAGRESANPCDFALVAMLGLLGLRIFEATGSNIADLGEEHGHRVLRVCGKGTKVVLIPLPPAVGRAIDRAIEDRANGPILLNTRGTRMDRHAAGRRGGPARRADRGPARRPAHHDAEQPGAEQPRPAPELHPGRVHGVRHIVSFWRRNCRRADVPHGSIVSHRPILSCPAGGQAADESAAKRDDVVGTHPSAVGRGGLEWWRG